jgi:hypothetical protein
MRALALASLLLVAGCSHDYKAEVRSNTTWSGAFNGATVDGSGDRTVDIDDEGVQCVVVQKQTRTGSLTVSIVDDGNTWFKKDGESKSTSAEFGVVTVCTLD